MIEEIIEFAIRPVVVRLSEEASQSISLKVVFMGADRVVANDLLLEAPISGGSIAASGEVRIILKDSDYPCGFIVEAILDGFSPETGFSGFSMRGKLKVEDEVPRVKLIAYSHRYKVREWSRDFRFK
ncbi:hypothetical protein [Aquimonas voraii]|nr:hypothetical protein [Aquimonas voraii]